MYLSTAVAAWLLASAPLPGEDAASAVRNIAVLLAQDSGIPAPAGSSPQTTDAAKLPPKSDEIIVSGSNRAPREDPIQALNIQTYALTQAVDTAIVAPAAIGYQRAIPEPIRAGVRHFFTHIALPVVFINDLLQLHPGRAAKTLARFAINSTVGIVGLVDVAKRKGIDLPYRPNGFANTLGYYGVKTGPFLFVPLIGPTTIRDLIGLIVDRLFLPNVVGKPFDQPAYAVGATLVGSIDYRAQYDAQLRKIQAEANPYAAARANYLTRRQAEIDALHGRVAAPNDEPTHVDGPPARR
jgi:phospholipid-binding lipoprotein MlaA